MTTFVVDSILYQIINNTARTLRVGNNTQINSNAVAGKLKTRIYFIETYSIDNIVYHLEEISQYSFRYCKTIRTVYVPDSVLYVRARAFDWSSLRKIVFSKKSRIIYFSAGSFYGTKLSSISIPESLSFCEDYSFSKTNLKDIYYCGNYEFAAISIEDNQNRINIHLSSSNKLESISNANIIKSDVCSLPNDTPYCTMKVNNNKRSFQSFLFVILFLLIK